MCITYQDPANTRHLSNAGPVLVHRLRRWPNIGPPLGGRLVFAGERLSSGWLDAVGSLVKSKDIHLIKHVRGLQS